MLWIVRDVASEGKPKLEIMWRHNVIINLNHSKNVESIIGLVHSSVRGFGTSESVSTTHWSLKIILQKTVWSGQMTQSGTKVKIDWIIFLHEFAIHSFCKIVDIFQIHPVRQWFLFKFIEQIESSVPRRLQFSRKVVISLIKLLKVNTRAWWKVGLPNLPRKCTPGRISWICDIITHACFSMLGTR